MIILESVVTVRVWSYRGPQSCEKHKWHQFIISFGGILGELVSQHSIISYPITKLITFQQGTAQTQHVLPICKYTRRNFPRIALILYGCKNNLIKTPMKAYHSDQLLTPIHFTSHLQYAIWADVKCMHHNRKWKYLQSCK